MRENEPEGANAPVKWAAEPSPQSVKTAEPPLHLNALFCSDSQRTLHEESLSCADHHLCGTYGIYPVTKTARESPEMRKYLIRTFSHKEVTSIETEVNDWLEHGERLLRELAHRKGCKINDGWIQEATHNDYYYGPPTPQVPNTHDHSCGIVDPESADLPCEENQKLSRRVTIDHDFCDCLRKIAEHLSPLRYPTHDVNVALVGV